MHKGSGILVAFYLVTLLVFLAAMWFLNEYHKWNKAQIKKKPKPKT